MHYVPFLIIWNEIYTIHITLEMESHKMLQIILTLPHNLIIIFWPRIMVLSVTIHLPSNFFNTGISQRTIMFINRWFHDVNLLLHRHPAWFLPPLKLRATTPFFDPKLRATRTDIWNIRGEFLIRGDLWS